MSYLYHYSTEEYVELKTLRKQGKIDNEKVKEDMKRVEKYRTPGPYIDHISFFMEQVPLDIISKCFLGKHSFWKSGTTLFEHKVDIESIGNLYYHVVESPLKTAIYDNFPDIPETKEESLEYFRIWEKFQINILERGTSIKNLLIIQKAYKGKVREQYMKISERGDFEEIKYKYAATVPHVMIYPASGIIPIKSIKKVHVY